MFGDLQAINALLEDVPLEVMDGYIHSIEVMVPWASILKDCTMVEIHGLELTVKPKRVQSTGKYIIRLILANVFCVCMCTHAHTCMILGCGCETMISLKQRIKINLLMIQTSISNHFHKFLGEIFNVNISRKNIEYHHLLLIPVFTSFNKLCLGQENIPSSHFTIL